MDLHLYGLKFSIKSSNGRIKLPAGSDLTVKGSVKTVGSKRVLTDFELTGKVGVYDVQLGFKSLPLMVNRPRFRRLGTPSEWLSADKGKLSTAKGVVFRVLEKGRFTPSNPLALAIAQMQILAPTTSRPRLLFDGGDVAVSFQSAKLFEMPLLPIRIGGGKGGVRLDLSKETISFTKDAWHIASIVRMPEPRTRIRFIIPLDWRGKSVASKRIKMGAPAKSIGLEFAPQKSGQRFPVHVDQGEAPDGTSSIIAPIHMENAHVKVSIGPRIFFNRIINRQATLLSASLVPPKNRDMIMHVASYSDYEGAAARWKLELDSSLAMRLRPLDGKRPGTWQIAPGQEIDTLADSPKHDDVGIYGLIANSRLTIPQSGKLSVVQLVPRGRTPSGISSNLVANTLLPIMEYPGGNGISTARPGQTFVGANTTQVANFETATGAFPMPLLDRRFVPSIHRDKWLEKVRETEQDAVDLLLGPRGGQVTHDTAVNELRSNDNFGFRHLFGVEAPPVAVNVDTLKDAIPGPMLRKYTTSYDYSALTVQLDILPDNPGYIIVRPGDAGANFNANELGAISFDPSGNFQMTANLPLGEAPARDGGAYVPAAIIKTSRDISLSEIFKGEGLKTEYIVPGSSPRNGPDRIQHYLDDIIADPVLDKSWTGVILFRVRISGNDSGVAGALVGDSLVDDLELAYFALTAETDRSGIVGRSTYGKLLWMNGEAPPSFPEIARGGYHNMPAGMEDKETLFRLEEIRADWQDSKVSDLLVKTTLRIDSFFAIRNHRAAPRQPAPVLAVDGRYEEERNEVTFIARFSRPLQIFPFGGGEAPPESPLKSVILNGATIRFRPGGNEQDGKLAFYIDGSMELQKFNFDGLGAFDGFDLPSGGTKIDFADFGLNLPSLLGGEGSFLDFKYPSLRFNLDLAPFKIAGVSLQLRGFGFHWGDGNGGWRAPMQLFGDGFRLDLPSFFIDFRIDFGPLSEWALKGLDKLLLDLQFGFQTGQGDFWSSFWGGLSAVDFKDFELDLTRFLSVRAETLALKSLAPPPDLPPLPNGEERKKVGAFTATDLEVKVLGKTILNDISLSLFMTPDGDVGFLVAYTGDFDGAGTGFKINWLLIGRDILLQEDMLRTITDIGTLGQPGDAGIDAELRDDIANNKFYPISGSDAARAKVSRWLFAAGIEPFGLFQGRFLFQDGAYAGIALRSDMLDSWFGSETAFGLLYEKGQNPDEDRVTVSLRVPRVVLPLFSFMGGVISFRIAFNGSFLFDVGFPWLERGIRAWGRSFGAIVTPFQGTGGFYIRADKVTQRGGDNETAKYLAVGGGYGFQGGLGASFNAGIVKVWASIGVYAVIDGVIIIETGESARNRLGSIQAVRLTGVVGVVANAGLSLDWWIISVTIEVTLGAEAELTMLWLNQEFSRVPLLEYGIPESTPGGTVTLALRFRFYATASGRACIGKGWLKVCKSIERTVAVPVNYDLTL